MANPEFGRPAHLIRNVAIAVGMGIAAWNMLTPDATQEENRAEVTETEVKMLTGTARTCVIAPNLRTSVELEFMWDSPHIDLPELPFGLADLPALGPPDVHGEYSGNVAGDVDICLKGLVAQIIHVEEITPGDSTLSDESEAAAASFDMSNYHANPDDKVSLEIDRRKLHLNRPRVNFPSEDIEYAVKDGHIVERQDRPVDPPELAFAADGSYVIEGSHQTGQDPALADLYEAIALGKIDIGAKALDTLNTAEQLAVSNPSCLDAIAKQVSLDELVTDSLKSSLIIESGFQPGNINISFKENTSWPTAAEIKDESGQTFRDKVDAFQANTPGGMKVDFAADCTASVQNNNIKARG